MSTHKLTNLLIVVTSWSSWDLQDHDTDVCQKPEDSLSVHFKIFAACIVIRTIKYIVQFDDEDQDNDGFDGDDDDCNVAIYAEDGNDEDEDEDDADDDCDDYNDVND